MELREKPEDSFVFLYTGWRTKCRII